MIISTALRIIFCIFHKFLVSLFWVSLVAQWSRICLQCRRRGFDTWVGKIPWRKKWQPTPVFLPGKFHGERNLVVHGITRVRPNLATKQQQHVICCCCCKVTPVVSDSMRPHRQQPTRLPRPWDSPGKNTGVFLPFPSPMHESETWKWSHSVVSNS